MISLEGKGKLRLKVWEIHTITAATVPTTSPVLPLSILTRGLTKILRIMPVLQLSNLKRKEEAHIQVTESNLTPISLASIETIRKHQALHCEPFLPKPLVVFAKALPPPPHSQVESKELGEMCVCVGGQGVVRQTTNLWSLALGIKESKEKNGPKSIWKLPGEDPQALPSLEPSSEAGRALCRDPHGGWSP